MDYTKLKNKNILITGVSGFVGHHLEKKLLSLGANVYGISKKRTAKKHMDINITNFVEVEKIIKKKKINICFHLAAEALVETGQKYPYKTFHTNLIGTLNVLELGRIYNMEKIIIASTAHVYGENKVPYFETYPPKPSRPYETSKTCADLIAQSYADTFNLPVLIPRFVNIYGPGDMNFERLIPKTIRSVIKGESPEMWGGDVLRQYLYIDDAIMAYLDLATVNIETVGKSRIFNFGSSDKFSVEELMTLVIKLSDKDIKIQRTSDKREFEIKSQYVSWNRAKIVLKWNPHVSLKDGLKKSLSWYKSHIK